MTDEIKHLNFYGLKVSSFSIKSLFESIDQTIAQSDQLVIYGYSLIIIPEFKKHPEILNASNSFDVLLSDGHWFYVLLKLFGIKVQTELSIPNFVIKLLNHADKNYFSVMLLGAEKNINALASNNLAKSYPMLKVCEGIDGYFKPDEEVDLIQRINQVKPDILLIGMSSPKKEVFAHKWRDELQVPIIVPCGGMIDVLAGKTKVTPILYKKLGLAMIYRIMQEPRRLLMARLKQVAHILFVFFPVLFFRYALHREFSIPKFYGICELETPEKV